MEALLVFKKQNPYVMSTLGMIHADKFIALDSGSPLISLEKSHVKQEIAQYYRNYNIMYNFITITFFSLRCFHYVFIQHCI